MDYAFLLSQLRTAPERLRALAAGLSPQQARYRPAADSWSFLEVLNHLVDEEIHDFRYRLDYILDPADKVWQAIHPGAWVTESKYNQRDLQETLDNFQRERAASIAWLASLGDVAELNWDSSHTYEYGSMRAGDMFAAWLAHDGLHLRQLAELHRAILEQAVGDYDIEYAGEW